MERENGEVEAMERGDLKPFNIGNKTKGNDLNPAVLAIATVIEATIFL